MAVTVMQWCLPRVLGKYLMVVPVGLPLSAKSRARFEDTGPRQRRGHYEVVTTLGNLAYAHGGLAGISTRK